MCQHFEHSNYSKSTGMPNDAYLDSSVAWKIRQGLLETSERGYRSTAEAILSAGLATEVMSLISAGKEADVYLCMYKGAPIAVKVYRMFRTSHKGGGPVKADSMGWLAAREFELTRQAFKGGARVPAPARRVENMFSMRFIGDESGPAPRLNDVRLEDPNGSLEDVLAGVKALATAGVVHSDLSAFNILVHAGDPWFIDLSEGVRVDRTGDSPWVHLTEARNYLERGIAALQKYYGRYGLTVDAHALIEEIIESRDKFGVMKE